MIQASGFATESITQSSQLASLIEKAIDQPSVALDIESDNYYRYPGRVCLIQMALPGRVYLIDPLSVKDMDPMGYLLADDNVEKIFHSSDFDLRSLDREWSFRVNNLFDTSIAAAFIGMPRLGLGTVLEEQLGVKIVKNKQLQRSDWGSRPLSSAAFSYAASDVAYLLRLRDSLGSKLRDLGRNKWVAEECSRMANIRYVPSEIGTAFLSMKGSRELDSRGLAILKELANFREAEALRRSKPPFRVLSDATLVQLAGNPVDPLDVITGLGIYRREPLLGNLRKALSAGLIAKLETRHPRINHFRERTSVSAQNLLKVLKEWRVSFGKHLGLDPALLWPMPSLERLSKRPLSFDTESMASEVRNWQKKGFGLAIRTLLAKHIS